MAQNKVPFDLLDKEQRAAVDILVQTADGELYPTDANGNPIPGAPPARMAIMTGGPGTGKTTCLEHVVDKVLKLRVAVALAAPTGKAARRLAQATGQPAKTLHSLLKGIPGEGFKYNKITRLPVAVVIVDEASMVDVKMLAALMDALPDYARLLLIGDANQLPPVEAGQPFTDIIRSKAVPVGRLIKTYRQAGTSWVVDHATRMIAGTVPPLVTTEQGGFNFIEASGDEVPAIAEAIKARAVQIILAAYAGNGFASGEETVVLTPQKDKGAGAFNINVQAQRERWNVQEVVRDYDGPVCFLHKGMWCVPGDPVMNLRNMTVYVSEDDPSAQRREVGPEEFAIDPEEREEIYLPNGAQGVCVKVEDLNHAQFEFDGKLVDLSRESLDMTLAYAMTVHKSQGSGWDHVVVIVDPSHQFMLRNGGRQLMYTAITRTQDQLTIIGSKVAWEMACRSQMSNLRQTFLAQFNPNYGPKFIRQEKEKQAR
ncbi:MAG: AAA family ATPase [bacterium]|nr:AAA family ATPase [bacterium]